MGVQLDKVNSDRHTMSCPMRIVNWERAGSVYFVRHKPKMEEKDCQIEKRTHFTLAIDMTGKIKGMRVFNCLSSVVLLGSSTHDTFIATHFDLFICDPTDHSTYLNASLKTRPWQQFLSIEKVGQITSNEIKNFHSSIHFARDLENRLTHHVYDPMWWNKITVLIGQRH